KLAAGVDPYKKINKRYLDHDERIHIADWRREGVSIREIARRLVSDAGFGYRCSGDPVLPGSG
ncbi:helix-turn-helix domain-containing protein, partial [Corynebacterium striatum]